MQDDYGRELFPDLDIEVLSGVRGWQTVLKYDQILFGELLKGSVLRVSGRLVRLGSKAGLWRPAQTPDVVWPQGRHSENSSR